MPESEPLEAEDARRAALRFPRSGVERKTYRAVGALIARAERELSELTGHDISDWTRAESLEQAAKHLREAGVLAGGLASHVRRACS